MTGRNAHGFAGSGRAATARAAPQERGERPPHGPGRTDPRGLPSPSSALQRAAARQPNREFKELKGEKNKSRPVVFATTWQREAAIFLSAPLQSTVAPGRAGAGASSTKCVLADKRWPRGCLTRWFLHMIYIVSHCLTLPFVLSQLPLWL